MIKYGMREALNRKYRRVLEILPDVAQGAGGKLILVGGTALALVYLHHRISIDLDFVPAKGRDHELKEMLKGALSSKGYQTQRSAYANQFVVQFEDASIKVEIFEPEYKIGKVEKYNAEGSELPVASLPDIFEMKKIAYRERHASRDLFDIYHILKKKGANFSLLEEMLRKNGQPERLAELNDMLFSQADFEEFVSVVKKCSPTSL